MQKPARQRLTSSSPEPGQRRKRPKISAVAPAGRAGQIKMLAGLSVRQLLRPIIRLLIRLGVMHREFADWAREVYVEVAREEHGLRGRPASVSRIALLTGLGRKNVRATLNEFKSGSYKIHQEHESRDRINAVLAGWHSDPDFLSDNQPRPLADDSQHDVKRGFNELVRRYGGDVPPTSIRRELLKSGAIVATETKAGLVFEAVASEYVPTDLDDEALARLGEVGHDLLDTLVSKLLAEADNKQHSDTLVPGLDSLSTPDREIVSLRDGNRLTFRQIADQLDLPLSTVRFRYQSAITRLREQSYDRAKNGSG